MTVNLCDANCKPTTIEHKYLIALSYLLKVTFGKIWNLLRNLVRIKKIKRFHWQLIVVAIWVRNNTVTTLASTCFGVRKNTEISSA